MSRASFSPCFPVSKSPLTAYFKRRSPFVARLRPRLQNNNLTPDGVRVSAGEQKVKFHRALPWAKERELLCAPGNIQSWRKFGRCKSVLTEHRGNSPRRIKKIKHISVKQNFHSGKAEEFREFRREILAAQILGNLS